MAKRILTLFSLLFAALFLFGFDGKVLLSDYKANNAEEEEIIATLIDYQKAYNENDKEKLLSFFREDAKLTPCGESWSQVSKDDYATRFPDKWKSYPKYEFYNPEILISGNKAKVKSGLESGGWSVYYEINMIKENGKWLIQETSF